MNSKFNEALTLFKKGEFLQSKNLCLEVLKEEPNNFRPFHILALIYFKEKDFIKSRENIEEAIKIKKDSFELYNLFAFILFNLKKFDLAIKNWDQTIKLNPDFAEAYNNKGNILFMQNKFQDALVNYDKSIEIKKDFADAFNNRGNVLRKLNKKKDSIESYKEAIKIKPNFAQAYKNLGSIFKEINVINDSIKNYEEAIKIDPLYLDALVDLGNILQEKGEIVAALNHFIKVLKIKYNFKNLLGFFAHVKLKICQWEEIDKILEDIEKKVAEKKQITQPWVFLTYNDSPKLQKITSEIWANKGTGSLKVNPYKFETTQKNKKIKIGYFSCDFHNHATSLLMANLFELHDRSKFEIIGFNIGRKIEDDMYKRVNSAFDKFFNLEDKSDSEIRNFSRTQNINIAVDLKGYTKNNRFEIFKERCAPIQINYLGYPGTLGSDCMDYIIADKILIPKESQKYYSEKIIYLPDSFQVNDSIKTMTKEFSREELGLPKDKFIFCSFNATFKILPKTFDVWMNMLKKVENSVLWLLIDTEEAKKNLILEAKKRGISDERIIFAKRLPFDEHISRLRLGDLFVDTFPCTGHTTCSDALRAGLPVITLQGNSFAGRVSSSLLHVLDLKELITTNIEQYENLAIELASNKIHMQSIRSRLNENLKIKPLFDCKKFTTNLEKAYLEVHRLYYQNNKVDNIEV